MVKSSSRALTANKGRRAIGIDALFKEIRARTQTPQFQKQLKELLLELCAIDTTPKPNPAQMRTAEARCFRVLERELNTLAFRKMTIERRPINPAIANHPAFSLLHFTKSPKRPNGLTPRETYAGRGNLVCVLPGTRKGTRGCSIALNAHLDVVAPYFSPSSRAGTVFGRGACDDKGPVVSMMAALKVLSAVMKSHGLSWNRNVLAMFVVEEETGGNGSLSLATDRQLKALYDSILVCECTGLKLHPANRGAVWYRAELGGLPGASLFELFASVNYEMEREGAAIRAESRHELFPQRPVQTCHGIIGQFGEHPSRICGEVAFRIDLKRRPIAATKALVQDCLESGLAEYVGLYGDKTRVRDPATGRTVVARHFDLLQRKIGFEVRVFGATGHMGAIREKDGAITKMAHLVRSLMTSKARLAALAGGEVAFRLVGQPEHGPLVIEGGQGFVPTHSIEEVMERQSRAAQRGAENYARGLGLRERGRPLVKVTYEKLHNAAFDGDPESPAMRAGLAAAGLCGILQPRPVLGWTVSCDARLFATEYPQMDVLTFGPGQLLHAHSDSEQITLDEIRSATEFLATFLLLQAGVDR